MKTIIWHIFFSIGFCFFQNSHSRDLQEFQGNETMHPRLILTSENVLQYKIKMHQTHKELYLSAMQLADEFCLESIPEINDAHNTHRRIGDTLPVLGLMYQLTGDLKYVQCAVDWISALIETDSWRGSQNLGRSSWIMGLALTYDWLYNELPEKLKQKLINRLIEEAKLVMETASYTRALSNHLLIETSAVGIVGLLLAEENENRKEFLNQANEWSRYIIDHAPLDGSWGEGVQYWQYGTGYFLRFLEAAFTSGYKNYFEDYDWLKKNGYFPIYFSLPDQLTKVINFSDCGTDRYLPTFLFYYPAGKFNNGYFQDFGEKIQSTIPHKFAWLDFLFYDSSINPIEFTTLPTFKHFEDHGFVSMRSGWNENSTVVGFRCGPAPGHNNQRNPERLDYRGFGPGHQQPDVNNFCIFAKNEWLVIDPGYTKLKETRNHNTLLVNGYGQAGAGSNWLDFMEFESREPVPEIIYTESNPVFDYVIGDAGNIYVDEAQLEFFRRHLLFLKPDIIIIVDDIKAKGISDFEWLAQFNEIANVEVFGNNIKISKNDVEFWVAPVLPESKEILLKKRKLKANDVHGLPGHQEGELQTISIKEHNDQTRYMVVIGIQENDSEQPLKVSLYENDQLEITINGRQENLEYLPNERIANRPIIRLKN